MPPVHYHSGQFPPSDLDWSQLIPLLGPANRAVARYDAVLASVQDPVLLLGPLLNHEAVMSNRIEGSEATLGEVLEYEARGEPDPGSSEKSAERQEVLNYRRALLAAESWLKELPLSLRLLRNTHEVLLQGVRGERKEPGEFRRIQNQISAPGRPIEEARYVPPPPNHVMALMGDLEEFMYRTENDVLVQLAVIHAEFEAVHPFLDGNGRLGRLIVPLFLYDKKVLTRPSFYISGYLEAHREEYVERLLSVSRDGDWTGWCVFFLLAVTAQAETSESRATRILDLYEYRKDWVPEAARSQYGVRAIDWVFTHPVFEGSSFIADSGIPRRSAHRMLRHLLESGLLTQVIPQRGRQSALYAYFELLEVAEGLRTDFA